MGTHDKQQLDRLDQIAMVFQSGKEEHGQQMFSVLSTGERCYVALAANRPVVIDVASDIEYLAPTAVS